MEEMKLEKALTGLENGAISLRTLSAGDITEEYLRGLNDAEINRYLVTVRQKVQTRESVEKFIAYNNEAPDCLFLGIFLKGDENPFVGTIRVSEIDFFHYSASIGICLFAKRAWKKGHARQAISLVKDYLFKTRGLHYLEAGAYTVNVSSIKAFLWAGFTEQYRIKGKYRLVDTFEEAIYLAAINSDFRTSLLSGSSPTNVENK
jgi:ribosomal-protein-alanine N-acetyltransferase